MSKPKGSDPIKYFRCTLELTGCRLLRSRIVWSRSHLERKSSHPGPGSAGDRRDISRVDACHSRDGTQLVLRPQTSIGGECFCLNNVCSSYAAGSGSNRIPTNTKTWNFWAILLIGEISPVSNTEQIQRRLNSTKH